VQLGAFGFLASEEVKEKGALNAGILDIKYALEWVQKHIGKFGGDARRVTISGISAGGGAVMLLGIAEDGNLGTSLFQDVSNVFPGTVILTSDLSRLLQDPRISRRSTTTMVRNPRSYSVDSLKNLDVRKLARFSNVSALRTR
jgi:carboxylesterase type B